MEGRLTATPGQKRAARYLEQQFKAFGLAPAANGGKTYQQVFQLEERSWGEVFIQSPKSRFENLEEFFYFGNTGVEAGTEMEAVYVGKGREEDIEQVDLEGKVAVLFAPGRGAAEEPGKRCQEAGAKALFVIYNDDQAAFKSIVNSYKVYLSRPQMGFPSVSEEDQSIVFYVSPNLASDLFGQKIEDLVDIAESGKITDVEPAPVALGVERVVKPLNSSNVVGFLEGDGKADEVIVITAHYDHLGTGDNGEVYNGADDDGSGTVSVLEIAQAFAEAAKDGYRPQRSILFMLVSGEERGLLGSDFYTRNPLYPLENTVANLNIDMVGRLDEAHEDDPYYVYLIGSDKLSSELHNLSEATNDKYTELDLDYRYNDENDPNRYYYRSDHYNFAKNDIPVIFYFNGTHEDYHQDTDTVEKIHFGKVERIARLVFYTAWELANREERIKVDAAP